MKNLKKVLAFVVVFAMMFTFAASANTFPDVSESASYAEAVTILSSLGLMIGDDNGNFNPDKVLTRAEAATLIVRAKGLESASAGAKGATQFTDVSADHWASGYINLATQTGIVAGMGDGTFLPENQVTYEQIVKMIVAALGYTPQAEAQGGYPTGYLVIASRKNITKGATGSAGDPAPRSTVARLLYNALEVPTMVQTVFSAGAEEYEESEESILTDALGYEKYEGTVTAVYPASSAEDTATTVDIAAVKMLSAKLANETYRGENLRKLDVGKTDAADYLGYYVTVYVAEDEDTGDDTIYAIAAKAGKNETITIDYSQLDKATDITPATGKLVYYMEKETDKSAKKIKISDDVVYYYNGGNGDADAKAFVTQAGGNDIYPGTVTFVDSIDENDGYDYIFVTEYNEDYVVDEVDFEAETITDVDGNSVDIDLDDEKTVYTFVKDGAAAKYEDIQVGDVLTFANGNDGEYDLVKVFISSEKVEGSVAEKRTDDNEVYFTIAGKEYRAQVNDGSVDDEIVGVGDEGTFYINVDGRIVYKDASSVSGGNYAYLFKAGTNNSAVSTDTVEIKYIKADGTWETKDLSSTITIYEGSNTVSGIKPGKVGTDTDKVAAVSKLFNLTDGGAIDSAIPQLIQYKTKSDGTVNKLYVAARGYNKSNFTYDYTNADASYNAARNKLGSVYINDDAIVFNVDRNEPDDEDSYSVSTVKATFKDDNSYDIVAYDEDSAGYPAVIVAYNATSDISEDTPILVIDRVTSSTNADGQDVYKFYGYQEGEYVSAESNEDLTDVDLAAGDVIIFALDAAGKIDKIETLFTTAQAKAYINAGTAPEFVGGDDVEEDFGFVTKKNSGNRIVLEYDTDNRQHALTGSDIEFYTVNLNRSKTAVSAASYSDITANSKKGKLGSWVYVRFYDDIAVGAVAYQMDLANDMTEAE